MKTYKDNSKGFSLMELLVVIAILGILVSTGTPIFISAVRKTQATQCLATRNQVENAVGLFQMDHPDAKLPTLMQLYTEGYLNGLPYCSAGGEYVWISDDIDNPKLGCSIHYWEETELKEEEPPEEKPPPKKPPKKKPPKKEPPKKGQQKKKK